MEKVVLLTGATDGIGLETAKLLLAKGHRLLAHGRNEAKLDRVCSALRSSGKIEGLLADLSDLSQAAALADEVSRRVDRLDVVINNAGVYHSPQAITEAGLDVRFAVNTLAPYILTQRLLPRLSEGARVVNVGSAAQAPVDLRALVGDRALDPGAAYAQSKLAITMWTGYLAGLQGPQGPMMVTVNPASLLGSKMVKEAFGVAGGDLAVGADILLRAALSDEFADASGKYYDNDHRRFAKPHGDALDAEKVAAVVEAVDRLAAPYL